MKLSQFKEHLDAISSVTFVQPNGATIPQHFHLTEAGLTTKHFVDCGGKERVEKVASFQVWVAHDTAHRLRPHTLKKIIAIAEKLFGDDNLEVEIEYQNETIGRYGLGFDGDNFVLTAKQTDCLAKDHCDIPEAKQQLHPSGLEVLTSSCCTTGSECC